MAGITAIATADIGDRPRSLHPDRLESTLEIEEDGEMIEPDMEDTTHMSFVDGRCSCCPYGYHIDLDFLRYCDSMSKGSYLRNLKKIRRNKRHLRKSMEIYLQQQERNQDTEMIGPPPDVINSTDGVMHLAEYEDTATNRILEEIDSSVNATLSTIDYALLHKRRGKHQYLDSDDDTDVSTPSPGGPPHHYRNFPPPRYRTEAELLLSQQHPHYPVSKSESMSSLDSSMSTQSSDFPPGVYGTKETTTTYTSHHHTYITSAQIAGNMAQLLPPREEIPAIEGSSPTDMANISEQSLQGIREQMALSLQRMRDLEEQVKTIPVLQVRLSVLKEEKRLLLLQLKSKNNKLNMCSIGVGDARIDDLSYGIPSAALPPAKPLTRSIGTGDGNVFDNQQVAAFSGIGQQQVKERELHSEQSSHIVEKQKEIHTVILGDAGDRDGGLHGPARKYVPKPKIPTRSIGVGDGNVFDTASNVHVHAKETKTLIIGGKDPEKKPMRNVGILCKSAMRDVGVHFVHEEEKPVMRTIGVGVNEGGLSSEGELVEFGSGGGSHTSIHHQLTSLQQLNMAAFHTKNIHIKQEDLRVIVNTLLRKDVHSKGVQVTMATEDKSINHVGYDMVSKACGDDTVDVDVRPIKKVRSIAVENRPNMVHRSALTDKVYTRDEAMNTLKQKTVERSCATVPVVTYPATTNTEQVHGHNTSTETDRKIFMALDQIRNTSTNTPKIRTLDRGTLTEDQQKLLTSQGFDVDIKFVDRGVNTQENKKYTNNKAVNTDPPPRRSIGVGDKKISDQLDREIGFARENSGREMSLGKTVSVASSEIQPDITKVYHSVSESPKEDRYGKEVTSNTVAKSSLYSKIDQDVSEVISSTSQAAGTTKARSPSFERGRSPVGKASTVPYERDQVHSEVVSNTSRTSSVTKARSPSVELQKSPEHKATGSVMKSADKQSSSVEKSRKITSFTKERSPVTEYIEKTRGSENMSGQERSVAQEEIYSERGQMMQERQQQMMAQMLNQTESSRSVGGFGPRMKVTEEVHTSVTRGHSSPVESRTRSLRYTNVGGTSESLEQNMQAMLGSSSPQTLKSEIMGMMGDVEPTSSISASSSMGDFDISKDSLISKDEKDLRASQLSKETTRSSTSYMSGNDADSDFNGNRSMIGSQQSHEKVVTHESPEATVKFERGSDGGTQMRVIRHTETTYVGDSRTPVNRKTNVVLKDEEEAGLQSLESYERRPTSSSVVQSQNRETLMAGTTTSQSHSRKSGESIKSASESLVSQSHSSHSSGAVVSSKGQKFRSGQEVVTLDDSGTLEYESSSRTVPGRTVTVTETRIERRGGGSGDTSVKHSFSSNTSSSGGGTPRSIMKQPGDKSPGKIKKEISFDENVTGGYISSSGSDNGGSEDEESEGSQSSTSYDEGSYDGRIGQIVYQCKDDQAIAQGQPGASMYDQNIRETFELSNDMKSACGTYAQWLEDSTQITSKQLNISLNVIQQEWFKVSSHKLSNPNMVEDYLSSFNEMSRSLLQNVINIADANGNTALHYAVSHCNVDIVNLLLDSGLCDVDKQNKAGYTAIMLASLAQVQSDGQKHVIRRLFGMGSVNAKAAQAGQTALMLAVSHGRLDMVKLLIEAGANINAQDDDGSTALMCASEHGHTDIVRELLSHSECDPTITDNDGSTALSIAMEVGHKEIGVLLYAKVQFKAGASPVLARSRSKRKSTSPTTSPRMIRR